MDLSRRDLLKAAALLPWGLTTLPTTLTAEEPDPDAHVVLLLNGWFYRIHRAVLCPMVLMPNDCRWLGLEFVSQDLKGSFGYPHEKIAAWGWGPDDGLAVTTDDPHATTIQAEPLLRLHGKVRLCSGRPWRDGRYTLGLMLDLSQHDVQAFVNACRTTQNAAASPEIAPPHSIS